MKLFLTLILLSPCVNFWVYDRRLLDWQLTYITAITIFFALYNLYLLIKKKTTMHLTAIDCIVGALFLAILVRFLFSDIFSFKDQTLLNLATFLILYITLRSMDKKSIADIVLIGFPAIGLLLSIHGLLQFIGVFTYINPFFRMGGTFANPSTFTNFLCITFPFSLYNVLNLPPGKRILFNTLMFTSTFVTTLVILLPFERSSFIGLFVSMGIILERRLSMPIKRKMVLVAGIALIGFTALYFLRPASARGRILIYRNTLHIIKDNSLAGIGPGKFPAVYPLYQSSYFHDTHYSAAERQVADNVVVAFNDYLQLVAEIGLSGMVIIIIAVLQLPGMIRSAYIPQHLPVLLPVAAAFCSIAATALFSYPFRDNTMLVYVITLAAVVSQSQKPLIEKQFSILKNIILSILLFIIIYTATITSYLIHAQYKWASISSDEAMTDLKIRGYAAIYPALDHNGHFLYNYGVELSTSEHYALSKPILEAAAEYMVNTDLLIFLGDDYLGLKEYEKSKSCYLRSIYIAPKKLLPKYALMQYYQATHNFAATDSLAEKILTERIIYPSSESNTIQQQALDILKDCNHSSIDK